VRLDTARRFALSLPETTEEPHFEKSSFRVRGKIFATVPPGGKHLHVLVEPDEAKALIVEAPDAFETTGRVPGSPPTGCASTSPPSTRDTCASWSRRRGA
jgi:hypothetical protein